MRTTLQTFIVTPLLNTHLVLATAWDQSAFFLPHCGLYRNGKLRVVFDCSAKDATGKSLNSYLEHGTNLLSCLLSVLLNVGTNSVGLQADIKAAFHQIIVSEEDRQFVQFLWTDNILRFQRVLFVLFCCSPYMPLKTISTHLHKITDIEPGLRHLLKSGIYMADLCLKISTAAEADIKMDKVKIIFTAANMELHKIRRTGIPSENSKVLGMT
ncbi:hypothetical protein Pmani_015025 [Petrolisthes manimaculis]|uniref:Reverse transcriptase domain-containing protein n=1 Tax=Petrolisthes manimaculis TaxID=1843537 RepID=A0AAE1PRQ4_9EUCA|nr:hypothetical protein Pmani_015025 [Petrolisthes manimaculis]